LANIAKLGGRPVGLVLAPAGPDGAATRNATLTIIISTVTQAANENRPDDDRRALCLRNMVRPPYFPGADLAGSVRSSVNRSQ
jgi:hypothetical protein